MARFTITDISNLRHYSNDSMEAAEYILSLRSNFRCIDYNNDSIRVVRSSTWDRMVRAIEARDVKWLASVLEIGYDDVVNKRGWI